MDFFSSYGTLEIIILIFIFIGISAFITRFIFSVDTFYKHQKIQTFLMIEMAKKNGVDQIEIDKCLKKLTKDEKELL